MRLIALLLFCLFKINSFSQSHFDSSKIRMNILNKLNHFPPNNNQKLSNTIFGFDYKTSKKISNLELIQLTNHPKVSVRMAALHLLVDRHVPETIELFTKNRYDTSHWCMAQFECFKDSTTFIDLLLHYFLPGYGWAQYFRLSGDQEQKIVSIRAQRKEELYLHYRYANQPYSN
ncbi:MAG: hypothetical protein QM737_20085 [Ferruginibacter sp.]